MIWHCPPYKRFVYWGYGKEQKLYEGDAIAPLEFPDYEIDVREVLRSGEKR